MVMERKGFAEASNGKKPKANWQATFPPVTPSAPCHADYQKRQFRPDQLSSQRTILDALCRKFGGEIRITSIE
jgi:hypothetical protein